MSLDPQITAARLASERPHVIRVLERHQIDYCCHGNRPLQQVCDEAGLSFETLAQEIEAAPSGNAEEIDWTDRDLGELVDYVVGVYHDPLYDELPRLVALARKVESVHGSRHPELHEVARTMIAISTDLIPHMRKEEEILFPWIREGRGETANETIQVMHHEHDDLGANLRKIRELTGDFLVPDDACGSYHALWMGMEQMERELHAHIHLENNILFPRALA